MSESPTPPPKKSHLPWLIATFFYIGRLYPGPGTWASGATVLLWWIFAGVLAPGSLLLTSLLVAIAVTLIGIAPATVVERESGIEDPGFVVIDEVAGQMIALIGAPLVWKYMIASFILFRGFDILKPFPLRRLEMLPRGTGIMMDDVGAGLYALVLMQLWLHFVAR
jgi:phosphatidylglycerophosphatase A